MSQIISKESAQSEQSLFPIAAFGVPGVLKQLSEIVQAPNSPVLPMIYIYQHQDNAKGQFKSYGQSIALQDNIQALARVLPRRPAEVYLKLETKRGSLQNVRPHTIREALDFFKRITIQLSPTSSIAKIILNKFAMQ